MSLGPASAMGSPGAVLRLIREGRALTRTDVMDITGLSRSTVMQRLGVLLSAGLLVEQPEAGPSSGGRRPAALTLQRARRAWCSPPTSGRGTAASPSATSAARRSPSARSRS